VLAECALWQAEGTKKPERNSRGSSERFDPLAYELDVNKLKRVKLGKGWEQIPEHLRSPKHLQEARAWLKRKNASTNPVGGWLR